MEDLLPYYERELAYLRKYGQEFADRYPKIAGRLLLSADGSQDPHVERLIESFALLSARVSKRIEDGYPEFTEALLEVMYEEANEDGALLIGVDLKKDPAVLETAYNDSAGVTARFNLNMLRRLNNELSANFDLEKFRHLAVYREEPGRIEMHLVSTSAQAVTVAGERFQFEEGESIRTECSHKYTLKEFEAMAERAGFSVHRVWTDRERLFSVQYCLRR